MFAAFKLSAVPININYSYVEGELNYVYNDADLAALLVHRSYVDKADYPWASSSLLPEP